MNRFDYVKYDDQAAKMQEMFKEKFVELEEKVCCLRNGRAKAIVMTKIEEAYMWVGKALRDEQIERNGSAPLMEQRKDG